MDKKSFLHGGRTFLCLSFRAKLLIAFSFGISSFQRSVPPSDTARAHIEVTQALKYLQEGDSEQAKPLLLKSVAIFEAAKSWEAYLTACEKLDDCFYDLKDWEGGITFFEKALERAEGQEVEQKLKSQFFLRLAGNYHSKGAYKEALAFYEAGVPFAVAVKDTKIIPVYYGNLGTLYWEEGDHVKALEFNLKSLEFMKGKQAISMVLCGIGDIYRTMKVYDKSISYFKQSLTVDSQNVQTWIQFSKAYQESGQRDSAFWALTQASPLLVSDGGRADYYYQYARLYRESRYFDKALEYIKKALQYGLKEYGETHHEYVRMNHLAGKIYLESGSLEEALKWFHQNLFRENQNTATHTNLTQNPTLDQLPSNSFWILGSLDGKGAAFFQKYKQTKDTALLHHALAAFELALDYGEKMRLSYDHESSKTELYEYLNPAVEGGIEAAMAMATATNDPTWHEKAFAFAERVKAAVMAEALYDKSIRHLANINDGDLETERLWEDSVAVLETLVYEEPEVQAHAAALTDARLELNRIKTRMEVDNPRYYQLKYAFQKNTDLALIRQNLPKDALLVEYFKSDSVLYTFALSKTGLKAYTTPITAVFDSTLLQFRRATSDWEYITKADTVAARDFLNAAPKLYDWLLAQPLADFKAKRLILAPDGMLGMISFDALLTRPYSGGWQDREIPYLLRQYPISYVWSASAVVAQSPPARGSYRFGGFGTQYEADPQPVAMRNDLGALPNADDEVRAIGKMMKGKSWLNGEATKKNFLAQAPSCDILHIATHGILNEENPMQSHLVFNQTQPETENRLFASELYGMELSARLVVLSACNTGLGKIAAGEGNMSIARALAYAGCPALVSNLWSADDQASAKLMPLFYHYLKAGATKDEALQQAKLTYLDQMDESVVLPAYWANFVIIGQCDAVMAAAWPWHRWGMIAALLIAVALFYYRRYSGGRIK